MDLSGTWRAAVADDLLRRDYPKPAFDDDGWEPVEVPSHWRSAAAFAGTDGPLLYRTRFEHAELGPAQRGWLRFEGVFYQSDVWLDGAYVGDAEGYFAPHTFEVTEQLRERAEHTVAVEVTCSPQRDRTAKRNLTGVFQHSDCFDPDWNPGGIWRPVRVHTTGPLAIVNLRVLCLEASSERAVLAFAADVDAAEAGDAQLRAHVADVEHLEAVHLSRGANRVEWRTTIERPPLWWPHAMGNAHLVDVEVAVETGDGATSDRRELTTGIRQVRMDRWIVSVNGERIFLKGANHGPTRMALGEATADEIERDIVLAKDAGLDFLRVRAHISRPELYDAADRHGLLLWQDLPLQWGYARSVRKEAVRQARQAVDLLGHHPSLAIWCAHNAPVAADVEPGATIDVSVTRKGAADLVVPTYNKTILDGSIHRALHKADRSRPVIPHSGVLGRTDTHVYFGWYHGHERDLPRFAAAWPRAVRFVTEFGAQAVPASAEFVAGSRWPDLDWATLSRAHGLQRGVMARNGLDPGGFATFDEWRDATQAHQVTVLKHHIETLRRLKYRPTGGFAALSFADGWPSIGWSVLDHQRRPKAGFYALVDACRPVIVVADRPEATYAPGDPIALDVHVVSDLRVAIPAARVTAHLAWAGGEHRWRWEGDVAPDAVVRVGTIQAVTPSAPGRLRLSLEIDAPHAEVAATNSYEATIVEAHHDARR